VNAAQDLEERMSSGTAPAVRPDFKPRISRSRALSRPWSASHPVVLILAGLMERRRELLVDRIREGRCPIGDDLDR
jgi:hypothetical protein